MIYNTSNDDLSVHNSNTTPISKVPTSFLQGPKGPPPFHTCIHIKLSSVD